MDIDYIIIQAGGLGSRLGYLTRNKPKAIVTVDNCPMIFHLFKKYPEKKFIIICDYKHDVLQKYLKCFADVKYKCVVSNTKGTCSGIKEALKFVKKDKAFVLTWSDLVYGNDFDIGDIFDNTVGLSTSFQCRWSFIDGAFIEKPSVEYGVAGFFVFNDKKLLDDVPLDGEFVRYLSSKQIGFQIKKLNDVKEVGTLDAFNNKNQSAVCRSFNQIKFDNQKVMKKPLNEKGALLATNEVSWYKRINQYKSDVKIPKIFSYEPYLCMECIKGNNPNDLIGIGEIEKKQILDNICNELIKLHSLDKVKADSQSIIECYYKKTFSRLKTVKKLIPFACKKYISINEKKYVSPFYFESSIKKQIKKIADETVCFTPIHGDCTFSNLIINERFDVYFIDPRGYFGFTKFYGDPLYDWAKVYYSIIGNYDKFNKKQFSLDIKESDIILKIDSSGFEFLEAYFLEKIPQTTKKYLKLVHALIWLSLTSYVWEDYDSICGAFYNGTMLLNEALGEKK